MGPGTHSSSSEKSLPSRPKFSWDGKSVPWTDGLGPQQKYAEAVEDWSSYHDLLPETNSNKYGKNVRGTILKSQLFGRARDLVRCVTTEQIQSEDGAVFVVNAIYKRDSLTVLSDVYSDFNALVTCRRGSNESFTNYETRFSALVSKFNDHGNSLQLPEPIIAFMLMASAAMDDNHRVSILAAAANDLFAAKSEQDSPKRSSADIAQNVQYETVASILRQCVRRDASRTPGSTLTANQGKFGTAKDSIHNSERLVRMKGKYPCRRCGKFGHWKDAHYDDGTLKPGIASHDKPKEDTVSSRKEKTDGTDPKNEESKPKVALGFTCSVESSTRVASARNISVASCEKVGPLVDDGAPYSAIGEMELHIVSKKLIHPPSITSKPEEFAEYDSWQYGSGAHASSKKAIIGSVELFVRTDSNDLISIRHLVIQGSSGWVIGRNLTHACDIQHIGGNALLLPNGDTVSNVDINHHSFIPLERFVQDAHKSPSLSCLSAVPSACESETLDNWAKLRRVVERVHRHTCGHESYSDMRTLLSQNGLWNDHVQQYLASTVAQCSDCKASSTPPPNRRGSISSLDRAFNDVVCIDHFHLEDVTLFHVTDVASRYSAAHVVSSTSINEAVYAFELIWISQFWPPDAVHADGAFQMDAFQPFLNMYDIQLRPVPPRRHEKNMIEPRHGVIRSIFVRLRHADPTASSAVLAIQSVRISNDLYGNDVVSSFELAKGFTRLVASDSDIQSVPEDIVEAHVNIVAKRKLNRILRSHTLTSKSLKAGDMVQVYIKHDMDKRGSWTSPRVILSIDQEGGFVVVPGRNGRRMSAAFEDARTVHEDDPLSTLVQSAIDELDCYIDEILDVSVHPVNTDPHPDDAQPVTGADTTETCDFTSETPMRPEVGERIEVFWPEDNMYYAGAVSSINDDGMCVVTYDDEEVETLNMSKESWRYENATLQASALHVEKFLESNEQAVIQSMMDQLGQRLFLWHHAQGFEQSAIIRAYQKEEDNYVKTVQRVPRKNVPRNANIVSSHVVYKIKVDDDESLRLKARIAPHGNEDSDTHNLRSDCCMCSPTGVRVVATVAAINRWRIVKVDVEIAFHQSGPADRKVYVIPPRESKLKNELWLLLVAGYGLVNANSKWQHVSDNAFLELRLEHMSAIPQLFVKRNNTGKVSLLVIKIVDDILAAGPDSGLRSFVGMFGEKFKLGTVCHGPGKLRFYGLWIEQFSGYSCSIEADEKLQSLEAYPITRVRRQHIDDTLNALERTAFMSINSSVSWLGTTVSLLCSFYSSHLQQRLPDCRVKASVTQINVLRQLKRFGTVSHYPCPKPDDAVRIVAFADASHSPDGSQLCYIIGMVYGEVVDNSIFHVLSWASHKSRRPVKSTSVAGILAASEALDVLIPLRSAMESILNVHVEAWELVDRKDLYNSLTLQRNSVDRSVRGDVNCIRFMFETELNTTGWIRGSLNPADVGTKPNSALTDAFVLMLATGRLQVDLSSCEMKSTDRHLG